MKLLAAWQNFYVVVGSAAGALIGLQFVVLSLIMNRRPAPTDPQTGSAFSTPTIIHFSSVLMLAAILCAPWQAIETAAILCGVLGVAGLSYCAIVTRRIRRQNSYRLVFEDWVFHALLPITANGTLIVSAFVARFHAPEALFCIGATALLLLFIGIHNAWDAVTYHMFPKSTD
jgi:hypothetical protein